MSKHTPGPWTASEGYAPQVTADGRRVTIAGVINGKADMIGGQHLSEIQANARLIAAAPELLEIAESMYAILLDQCGFEKDSPIMSDARAAIAKAEGGAT